jgi:hypothetical protein
MSWGAAVFHSCPSVARLSPPTLLAFSRIDKYPFIVAVLLLGILSLPSPPALCGATLTLNFYDSKGAALTFRQVQSTQTGPGVGAYPTVTSREEHKGASEGRFRFADFAVFARHPF